MIRMPPRNSVAEQIARAASKCLRLACDRHYTSVELGSVVDIVSGGTPSTTDPTLWDGEIVWVTPKDLGRPRAIEITESERRITQAGCDRGSRLLPKGTVLLSSRAPIGHLGIAAVPLCTNQGFKNLICSSSISNRYLFHMLRASIEDLDALGRGNTFKEIPARVVKEFEIPLPPLAVQAAVSQFLDVVYLRLDGHDLELPNLPTPLAEQRRIVARIDELAAKIEEARGLRRQALAEAEALLYAGLRRFRERLIRSGQTRYKLDDLTQVTSGGTPRRDNPTYWRGTIPWIKTGELRDGDIQDAEEHVTAEAIENSSAKIFPPETILIALYGQGQTRGRTGRLLIEAATNQACAAILPSPDRLEPRFTQYWLRSLYLEMRESNRDGAQPNWNGQMIKDVEIVAPSLYQQREAVVELDSLLAHINAIRCGQGETAAELDALLPSILDKAFNGEL